MLVQFNDDGTTEVVSKKKSVLCTIDRVREELEDFIKYKHLNNSVEGTPKANRYINVTTQEFTHFLLAMDDLFTELVPCLTESEKSEFKTFISSIKV